MRTARTYYEILGLPREATTAQIRRRYKELVRRYHPDVARDKELGHKLFLQLREAYETLIDSSRRASYDASLDAAAARTTTAYKPPAASSAAKHLREAQWSFIQRRFNDAAAHCKEALRSEPRSAKAHAVMGDIYRAQGKINWAIKAYSYAVQFDPSDRETQRKLDRLLSKQIPRVQATGSVPPSAPATRMSLVAIWWSVAFFLILLIGVQPGKPMPWLAYYIPQISKWSLNLVVLMAAASAVVGMLLRIGGFLQHPDDELVFESSSGNWALIPTGIILLIGSGFFFIGAAAFYTVVGLLQGSLSRSVVIVFAAVAGVVLLASVVYHPEARRQVIMFGGNVSFLSMLFGWYLGSLFRPLGEV